MPTSSTERIIRPDNISSLAFIAFIKNANNNLFCFTTSDKPIIYKDTQAQNAMRFDSVLNALATSRNGSIEIALININPNIDLFNSTVEIVLFNDIKAEKFSIIFSGFISNKTNEPDSCTLNIVPLTTKLNYNVGEFFSEFCRAELGDSRCRVDLSGHKEMGTITRTISNRIIQMSPNDRGPEFFANGVVHFISGANKGFYSRIMHQDHETIYLLNIPPSTPAEGDEISLTPGCDKGFLTCKNKFQNIINFRGEPFINGVVLKSITEPVEQYQESSQKGGK
jgi:uncharacterized phage protein (TIGR02218 family)